MFDFDEAPNKPSALRSQEVATLDFYGSNDNYNDCDLGIIFFNALQYLQKENNMFSSFNS